jgi:hypothetical protein
MSWYSYEMLEAEIEVQGEGAPRLGSMYINAGKAAYRSSTAFTRL